MAVDQLNSTVTERDRRLVEQYLGAFLLVLLKAGPNSAVANNARRAAEEMVAAERERVAKFLEQLSYYDQTYTVAPLLLSWKSD